MKTFIVNGNGTTYTFKTNDNWSGLWAPLNLLDSFTEPDGKNPGYKQVLGTAQVSREGAVRRSARDYVANHTV